TGVVLGTPRYMAPEQAQGHQGAVGPPADVYSLGVILYELLTLLRPFDASSDLAVMHLSASEDPLPPRKRRREVPRDLDSICLKCLEKDPRRRYATGSELSADLRRYRRGEPILARRPSLWARLLKWSRRRPAAAALVAASIVVCAA